MENEPIVYELSDDELSKQLGRSEVPPMAWMIAFSSEEEGIRIIPGTDGSIILHNKAEAEYFKACLDHCIQNVYKSELRP